VLLVLFLIAACVSEVAFNQPIIAIALFAAGVVLSGRRVPHRGRGWI
jgi:hypothetical protein